MRKNACALFVYGTLKRGFHNHYLIEYCQFIGDKILAGFDMARFDYAPFPIVIPNGKGEIHGEVFLIDEETLAKTDRLEGHPHMYLRTKVGVVQYEDQDFDLFVYVWPRENLEDRRIELIKSGIFKK